jgi:hypothetical protein
MKRWEKWHIQPIHWRKGFGFHSEKEIREAKRGERCVKVLSKEQLEI